LSPVHPLPRIDGLQRLGWDRDWEKQYQRDVRGGEPGRVIGVDRGSYRVATAAGVVRATVCSDRLQAIARDQQSAPCTGDWCELARWADGPITISRLLPRRTAVVRSDVRGRSWGQVLVANADVIAVVLALEPLPVVSKIERLLALAWESGADPLVILTKADLAADVADVVSDVQLAAPGVDVVAVSCVDGRGLIEVHNRLGAFGTLALIGPSGVGKSSLTNALVGCDVLMTKQIRADGKGRHTSARRELVPLPGGGAVVDTPGLRGVGLMEGEDALARTFSDVEALVEMCRFGDCTHTNEPGCAVLAALESGELSYRRFESWQKLRREMRWIAARTDARVRAERNRDRRRAERAAKAARQLRALRPDY
jgi:ribosome biogenesis GTPase / thiamine phosphate phosphatase